MDTTRNYTRCRNSIVALIVNLLTIFVVYNICRLAYILENYEYLAAHQSAQSLWQIFKGGYMFDRSAIVYTNSLYIVIMLFPLFWKETPIIHKIEKWIFVVVNSLAVVVNLCDAVYFPFTLRRTTTSVFSEFKNDNNLGSIFLQEFVNHWYLVILGILLIYALWRLYITPTTLAKNIKTRKQRLRYTLTYIVAMIITVPLAIGACRGGLGSGIRPITINNANQYVERPIDCAAVLNTPFALLRTIGKSVFVVPNYFASVEEAEQIFSPIQTPIANDNQTKKKKNIVILIVESFGREYIGALNTTLEGGKYKGYTPNVDRLIERSLTFEHSFCNGQKSIDGMPSVLSSIPMMVEPFVLTPASMNEYTSIAGLLSKEGYQTAFFHGANRGSMGFMAFANKVGFQNYYGRQDYAADPRFGGDKDFDGNWGIWDEPFLQYYCAKMTEMKEPFMTAVFTVSSHHPFVVPDKYKDVYKEEELPIHKCIRYTDMAIGKFFETASRQPWYKNTIFVLTSDHTNQSNHPEYSTDIGRFRSPIIIFDPSGDIEPARSTAIAQQIDIMPTLLNHIGYKKNYLAFGYDLINRPAEESYAINYLNGTYQYVKGNYIMQFDGQKAKAVYTLNDSLMKQNIIATMPKETREKMELETKAIIYQYMYRMVNDKLMYDK